MCAAMSGGCAFIEHPGFPTWKARSRPGSIWAWKLTRWIAKLACTQITTVDQCLFGCTGKKPTTFMTIRLPMFRQLAMAHGHSGRCHHGVQHLALIGRDLSGQFRTQRAKVYPPKLNGVLAAAIASFLKETAGALPCSQELPQFLATLQSHEIVPEHIIQKDYHG